MKYCDKINCHAKGLICIPETTLPRVVVVGGGFAGLNLVKRLKNKPVQVVLFDKNNYHQFIPLLYQVATSAIEPDNIVFPYRKMFRKYKNLIYRMAEVKEVSHARNTIITSVGEIKFDFLVIATGSTTNFFGNKDITRFSQGLKSLTDALDIRSHLLQNLEDAVLKCIDRDKEALGSVMIVGGGPAGVEMAGALAEFKRYIIPKDYPELRETPVRIMLVEGTNRLLQQMPEKLSDKTYRYLQKMGVDIKLHTLVKNYNGDIVEFENGEKQRVSAVLWTAGIKGELLHGLGNDIITPQTRITVDEYSRIIGLSNIFAIGDIALMQIDRYSEGHPMVAQVAIQQGKTLAFNILNCIRHKPLQKFKYKDKGAIATIGKRKAVAYILRIPVWGFPAWLLWSLIHLMGIIGVKNKFLVGINWLWSYFTYDKGDRLIVHQYTHKQRP